MIVGCSRWSAAARALRELLIGLRGSSILIGQSGELARVGVSVL